MTFEEWLETGLNSGFCSEQFCETHDVPPMTEFECDQFDEGFDPCLHMVRLGAPEDWENE